MQVDLDLNWSHMAYKLYTWSIALKLSVKLMNHAKYFETKSNIIIEGQMQMVFIGVSYWAGNFNFHGDFMPENWK